MKKAYERSSADIYLLARSGNSYLNINGPNWDNIDGFRLKSKIEEKFNVTIIIENPFSENGKIRRRADGNALPWRDLSWERIEELNSKYENLTFLFTGLPIMCSLFFTDNIVFYDPYHFGRLPEQESTKNHFLVFEFNKPSKYNKISTYNTLKSHFDFIMADEQTLNFVDFKRKFIRRSN
jgi:hypothetical protein